MADIEKELRDRAEWRAANEGPFTKESLVEWRAADELSRLGEVERILRGIHAAVADSIKENGLPNHTVTLPDGTVVEDPIVDMFRNVLVAIRDVAIRALSERKEGLADG